MGKERIRIAPQKGPQADFLACPADEIFYGGARGGGKSHGVLLDFAAHAFKYGEHVNGVLFRRTYPELEDLQTKANKMYPYLGAIWRAQARTWLFPSGASMKMRFLANEETANNYIGHEYTWMGFDQLDSWPKQTTVDKLKANLRNPHGIKSRMVSTGNPGGVGHNWIKARYIDPCKPRKLITNGTSQIKCFIPATVYDNKILLDSDPTYIDRLKESGPEWLVRAWLHGDWDIVAGGMFDDVWKRDTHVIEPFEIPKSWRVDRSFDWGSSAPFSVQWWAESDGTPAPNGEVYPRGTLFHIAEWYGYNGTPNEGIKMLASEIARGIIDIEKKMNRRVSPAGADPSIFATSNGTSIADEMARVGVRWEKADNARKAGWEKLRRLMKASLKDRMEEAGLFVFSTCRNFIRTVPSLPRDSRDMEDLDTSTEDHIADACRYRIMRVTSRLITQRIRSL
jgi:hypothetical protein